MHRQEATSATGNRDLPGPAGVLSSAAVSSRDAIPARAQRLHPRDRRRRPARGPASRRVVTRFPPEPNGYLHIGHAKSICLNFGIAREFGGRCHLRFDDTNPMKEEQEYIDAIEADVRWLGFDWGEHLYFASDYFEQLYEWAVDLIKAGKAYVDDLIADEIREHRGTLTEPGRESPWRDRPAEENLDLFARMRAGEFPDGARVLRAKIDMAAPNINLRDPVLYRILHAEHPRTGDAWCIYPMYDFAHGQSDAIEGITHSICTLEFEDHRPLYDWLIDNLPVPSRPAPVRVRAAQPHAHRPVQARAAAPRQRGARARLGRPAHAHHLGPAPARLPRRGHPRLRDAWSAWPRPTASSRSSMLEHAVRDVLNRTAPRRFAVLDPLKVVIENYPEGQVEEMEVPNNPEDPSAGHAARCPSRASSGSSATTSWRSRRASSSAWPPAARCGCASAYFVTCREVVKDAAGTDRRAALHLRPGHARRRRSRRPPPQGDAALGVGRARRARRGPALRPPLHAARTPAPTAATSSTT